MDNNDNKIIIELTALNSLHKRLSEIEKKIDDLASIITSPKIPDKPELEKKMMTLKEVARVYGMSLATLRRKASMREIPLVKIWGRVYVNIADFEEWLNSQKIEIFR